MSQWKTVSFSGGTRTPKETNIFYRLYFASLGMGCMHETTMTSMKTSFETSSPELDRPNSLL